MEFRGEQGAVLAGIRIPAVPVPYALRAEDAVVRHDVPAVQHVHVPAGPVFQRQPGNPDVLAVAQVDQPAPGPSGNRMLVLVFFNFITQRCQLFLQPFLFRLDDVQGQLLSAAPDGSAAENPHVPAVCPGAVIHLPQVQQTLVAHHLCAFKPAPDLGQIIRRILRPLQHRAFLQPHRHAAVQPQGSGQVNAPGEENLFPLSAGVQRGLQRLRVQGCSVARGAEIRHRQAFRRLLRPRGNLADLFSVHLHPDRVLRFRLQPVKKAVRPVRLPHGSATQHRPVFRPRRRTFRLIPPQG